MKLRYYKETNINLDTKEAFIKKILSPALRKIPPIDLREEIVVPLRSLMFRCSNL